LQVSGSGWKEEDVIVFAAGGFASPGSLFIAD
jgi:hypothetical protein